MKSPTRLAIEAHIDESVGQVNGQITAIVSRFVLRDLLQEHDAEVAKLTEQLRVLREALQRVAAMLENAYGNSSFHPKVAAIARAALNQSPKELYDQP